MLDAADLLVGDRLLNDDGSWAEVVSSEVTPEPLRAYNLTVEVQSGWRSEPRPTVGRRMLLSAGQPLPAPRRGVWPD